MNPLKRTELVLRALTVILVVISITAPLWRLVGGAVEISPASLGASAAKSATLAAIDPAAGQTIVNANIFSPTRKAPAARYSPFATEPVNGDATMTEAVPVGPALVAGEEQVPQLYGTVVGPGSASALMRLDAGTPGAQLYREGDRGGSFRVVKISEQSVTLRGPGGQVVLRLKRPDGQ